MDGERRFLSQSVIDAAVAVLENVPPGKSGVFIAGVDIRRGQPVAVVMIGERFNDNWTATFVYSGSKAEGHVVSATVVGSW